MPTRRVSNVSKGKNIAGHVSLQIGNVDEDQFIGLTFTESSLWISNISCDATQDAGMDEPYWFQPTDAGNYTTDSDHERGGFRYLTLVHNTTGSIAVESVSVYFTAMPHYEEDQIANYTGYFHCDDELLNRIWYAGAYTNQLCTVSILACFFGAQTVPLIFLPQDQAPDRQLACAP